jgi:sulfite reductase (NADPH) hemoprotein beta-component
MTMVMVTSLHAKIFSTTWVTLEDTPDILTELAMVEMHAIQTSGNCIHNITSNAFAGVTGDEYVDTRPICKLLRQWSTLP